MKKGLSTASIKQSLQNMLRPVIKHATFIFVVFVLIGLIFTVYRVQSILSMPPDGDYRLEAEQKAIKTQFNDSTIDKIKNLRQRQETDSIKLPSGRINPFTD